MNTEHAGRQKAEEGFPRLGQATPQGQKGYPKDEGSILQKEKLPSSKPGQGVLGQSRGARKT